MNQGNTGSKEKNWHIWEIQYKYKSIVKILNFLVKKK